MSQQYQKQKDKWYKKGYKDGKNEKKGGYLKVEAVTELLDKQKLDIRALIEEVLTKQLKFPREYDDNETYIYTKDVEEILSEIKGEER